MKNQVQLITYVDRLGGRRDSADLKRLKTLLCDAASPLGGVFGGVHLLPFFHAIDGADAGFDPIDHTQVDPRLGGWEDIQALTDGLDVMADVIVNHMSAESPQFLDYSEKGEASAYAGLFLTLDAVFPQGASERELLAVYRPRPGLPLTYAALKNGERRILWTTFTAAQIDIAVRHPQGRAYLTGILKAFADNGIRMVRLDAVGYAIKKAGASCFMMPETFDFIGEFAAEARALGIEVLVEIHSYFQRQIDIASKVDWVYDFALPPLVLHAFSFRTAAALKRWIAIRPTNALTVLDTHDGIGIIDIGADASDREAHPGLVPPDELDALVDRIHAASQGQSRQATGAAASNLDLYQVNCTFFDAMGRDETAYLLARALQFFLPGVPQVYYVGLLAGHNDMDLLARTQVGRDINRHYYDEAEIARDCERPVVRRLIELIRLRNTHPAFGGRFEVEPGAADELCLRWHQGDAWATLRINFASLAHELSHSADDGDPQRFAFS
ncbi:sucrose phosphorylase [Roseateles asaccharophilus]|uniref:Sucrose phosphorylase n=1 Tax=Roseateles asaccharophilus TaxID=582607 RepID=A0ABU2A499_9BURK|nr:sucrose phosphorylase [Roseateles asaccharophilus]MDR7332029.1 sucrose phosphorylase [Roseateles asaccharophilus]